MKLMQKSICALAVLAATATSFTAQAVSVDLKVIGTITPPACTPTLTGGGTVDYGTISTGILSKTDYTVLPVKSVSLTIACDAPAKVGLYAVNKRPNSLAGATENALTGFQAGPVALPDLGSNVAAGLGLSGTNKIGGFGLAFAQTVTIDGVNGGLLYRAMDPAGTNTWNTSTNAKGVTPFRNSGTVPWQLTWGATGTTVPVAFESMTTNINVQAYINKSTELGITGNIPLDGMVTFEMVYL